VAMEVPLTNPATHSSGRPKSSTSHFSQSESRPQKKGQAFK
jgi:hypothetical protein